MKGLSWAMGIGLLAVCLMTTGCQQKPTADFSASVTSGAAPLAVQFTDVSAPGSSAITAWHWLFGDGAESTEQNPLHVYAKAAPYNVSLEVTSSAGSDTALKLSFIRVTAPAPGAVQTVLLSGGVPLEMVWIPEGAFTMGSPDTEPERGADEGPQHSVTPGGFWMGKYELTQAQWKAVMGGKNPSYFQGANAGGVNTDNRPVEQVSWAVITQTFLPALNTATGITFRLPSEAEWEYACRADTTTRFYWGDDLKYTDIGKYAWYYGNSGNQTHDAGGKTANAFGLYDMSGNVWEWVQDWYHNSYTGAPADGSAWESPAGVYRVVRGGSWRTGGSCRSARRENGGPLYMDTDLGFRLAM